MSSFTALDRIFEALWKDYSSINPQAFAIHRLLGARGESIFNDHVAFRTYNDSRVSLEVMAQVFKKYGYVEKDTYHFEEKKLLAKYYQHPDPRLPKVFISELLTEKFSNQVQDLIRGLIDQMDPELSKRDEFVTCGRPWQISRADFEVLAAASEYAGWMGAFGFRANHFTVDFNRLKTFKNLEELNQFLKQSGFALNTSGGEIKGAPQEYLEQSSTLAAQVEWNFSDGPLKIPACYYEFARRYPLPSGELYPGFIAASADKIFESTNRQKS
jgi:hypothetical protein